MGPGGAVGAFEQGRGGGVVGDGALGGIVFEGGAGLHGDVSEDAAGAGNESLFDVGDGFAAGGNAAEEVAHVAADGGGDVFLQVLFGLVFGVLLQFHGDVFVDGLFLAAAGDEVVAVHAGFERSLFSIESSAPWVFGIGGFTVGTVGPGHLEITKVKGGVLGICNVSCAVLVHQNAAGAGDANGPAEIEHPADHVQHVDAHVADDAISVFHKGAPAAGVAEFIPWQQRGGAGPEVFRARM